VQTAQVGAWAAVHKGSFDDISCVIDESLADAALARMMLYLRHAVVSQVIDEFFTHAGAGFTPYLAGLVREVRTGFAGEIAAAKAAGELAEVACSSAPPLLFERAMLAEMEGRSIEALADLDQLLDAYPGFVVAAFAAARLALAAGEPGRAIQSLACVERELVQTREGAALLADALRAVGLYEAASRYDLAALVCGGQSDSRGNDCPAVDVMGNVATDDRMPPAFYVETLPDGRILYNDRGVYYLAGSAFSGVLSALFKGRRSPSARGRPGSPSSRSALSPIADLLAMAIAKLGPVLYKRSPDVTTLRVLPLGIIRAWRRLSRIRAAIRRSVRSAALQLATVLNSLYACLPGTIRRLPIRFLRQRHLTASIGFNGEWSLFEIPERNRHSQIVKARVRSGITAIFGVRSGPLGFENPDDRNSNKQDTTGGTPSKPSDVRREAPLGWAMPQQSVSANALPPMAMEVLRRLMREAGVRRDGSPRS